MELYETLLLWLTIILYALSGIIYIYTSVFRKFLRNKIPFYVSIAGFILHTSVILLRWYYIGNLPAGGIYESSIAGTWVIMSFFIILSLRYTVLHITGAFIMPLCLLILGFGIMSGQITHPMPAALRSIWLYVHVVFAWISFGSFAICSGLGLLYILKEKNKDEGIYVSIPEVSRIDELIFRYLVFGFITLAIMIASGSIWAKNLWGSYWSWDPVETWSLVTWLVYGIAIHLRRTLNWHGRRFAIIMIISLPLMIITFFGIDILVRSSLHIFDVWKRL